MGKSTVSLGCDGNLSIEGTFNFEGSLVELRNIIDKAIEEFGDDRNCELTVFRSFPHRCSTHIILR